MSGVRQPSKQKAQAPGHAPASFPSNPSGDPAMLAWLERKLMEDLPEAIDEFARRVTPASHAVWEAHGQSPEHDAINAAVLLNYEPLIALLRTGTLSPTMQQWLAGYIADGGFRERKSFDEKETYEYFRAVMNVPRIVKLWHTQYGSRAGSREQAIDCAAALDKLDESTLKKFDRMSVTELRRRFSL